MKAAENHNIICECTCKESIINEIIIDNSMFVNEHGLRELAELISSQMKGDLMINLGSQ